LTPCCGLEVHNPSQALKSVKDPENSCDLSPKWDRTLPSFGNLSCHMYRVPLPQMAISKLIVDTLLCCIVNNIEWNGIIKLIIKVKYIRVILNLDLDGFNCI
jgi:hypothetical protein